MMQKNVVNKLEMQAMMLPALLSATPPLLPAARPLLPVLSQDLVILISMMLV